MKKRTREIVVNNISYIWMVDELLYPKGLLKVWIEGEKSKPYIELEFNCHGVMITPSIVKKAILYTRKVDSKSTALARPQLLQLTNEAISEVSL